MVWESLISAATVSALLLVIMCCAVMFSQLLTFTGATRDRAGVFETASTGTVFLDEIGELPLALQVKLLRVIQESTFRRLGETADRKSDVRLVAATVRDLAAEVKAGRFREDLFYRLHVLAVTIPPRSQRPWRA